MNNKIIVKKIWSLNPRKYEKMTLKEASKEYKFYVLVCVELNGSFKTFDDWLATEI